MNLDEPFSGATMVEYHLNSHLCLTEMAWVSVALESSDLTSYVCLTAAYILRLYYRLGCRYCAEIFAGPTELIEYIRGMQLSGNAFKLPAVGLPRFVYGM
jgi:hypothetical protein